MNVIKNIFKFSWYTVGILLAIKLILILIFGVEIPTT